MLITGGLSSKTFDLRETLKKHSPTLSVAEFYHELTKYSPENISATVPDPLQKPSLFKEYLSERAVDLKPFLKGIPEFSGVPETPKSMLRSISRFLYHTGGITEIAEGRGGIFYFRAAPSAGALYPTEIYLATSEVPGLSDGIHSYSVREHALVPIWDGNFTEELKAFCFHHAGAVRAKMILILSGVFHRSAWRYRDRAYRRILLDAGHVLGNAAAYAQVEGLGVVTMGGFFDAAVNDLLFLDQDDEGVLLMAGLIPRKEMEKVQSLKYSIPSPRHTPPPAGWDKGVMLLLHERSRITPNSQLTDRIPQTPMKFNAEGLGRWKPEASIGFSSCGEETSIESLAPSIGPVIRRRRSARAFGKGSVGLKRVAGILRSAYAPLRSYLSDSESRLDECLLIDPTMISTYLVATRVEGLPAGIYWLDPADLNLYLKRKGNFQRNLWNLCLGQELGRDSAIAVVHVADLAACVQRYGDRAYRYLHLDAGHLGERINLAAISREVGVCGIGGFFDSEVNVLLDLPEKYSTLYITLLGQPADEGLDD